MEFEEKVFEEKALEKKEELQNIVKSCLIQFNVKNADLISQNIVEKFIRITPAKIKIPKGEKTKQNDVDRFLNEALQDIEVYQKIKEIINVAELDTNIQIPILDLIKEKIKQNDVDRFLNEALQDVKVYQKIKEIINVAELDTNIQIPILDLIKEKIKQNNSYTTRNIEINRAKVSSQNNNIREFMFMTLHDPDFLENGVKSYKLGNITLNLKKLLITGPEIALTTIECPDNVITISIVALIIIIKIVPLLVADVCSKDALVVYSMRNNTKKENSIGKEEILNLVNNEAIERGYNKITAEELEKSLEKLEKIKCIKKMKGEDKWWLKEKIIIKYK